MSRLNLVLIFLCSSLLFNTQCDEDDFSPSSAICDQIATVDNTAYENAETAFDSVVSVEVLDDCLNVRISSSGCDGNSWEFELIDSGNVAESFPPQRYLKYVLTNNEACLAVFSREKSFELIPLRVEGVNEVLLNIEGFPESISYSY